MRKNKKTKFSKIHYSSIKDIRTTKSENKLVKFGCHIGGLDEPRFERTNDDGRERDGEFRLTSSVTFKDDRGRQISSLPISKSRYDAMEERLEVGEPVEVIGRIMKIADELKKNDNAVKYKNKIEIIKTRSGDTPFRRMQASELEKSTVERCLNDLIRAPKSNARWELFNALKDTITQTFGIVGIDRNNKYSDTLDAIITQAFSGGTVGNTNGKIHVAAIGPPSAGKKLFFEAAKLLNIVSQEAQSGRISSAGLTGTCVPNGGWKVEKGSIPLAHKGVFGMQDFDKSQLKPKLLEILGPVMEDGKCIISKAGKASFLAETAIYIDLNRASDLVLDNRKRRNVVEDTGLQTYIISRLDYICELKKDPKGQFQNAIDSIKQDTNKNKKRNDLIYKFCKKNDLEVDRFLKLITAYLMEHFDRINTDPVKSSIEKKYKKLMLANRKNFDLLNNAAMFQMRFKNSIYKFIEALTRIQLLKVSNDHAVDKAFQLLSRKLKFLKAIDPALLVPNYRITKAESLGIWLANTYGKKRFSPKRAFKKYEKDGYPAGVIKERQFRNLLRKVAIKKEHREWAVKSKFLK